MTALSQDDRLLVSIKETARILGIGRSTVWSMIGRGDLKTCKLGRARRVTLESIRALASPNVQ